MNVKRVAKCFLAGATLLALGACGDRENVKYHSPEEVQAMMDGRPLAKQQSIFDVFRKTDPDVTIAVNRYLWGASLDVLSFLPVESVDPFSGIIVFGYGTPPGSGRAYRATVHIKDPALDARSLLVAINTRSGPVATGTRRAVEDAILARARQLRMADRRY